METTQGAGVDFTGLLGSMLHALIEPVTGAAGGYPDSMFLNLNEEEKENNGCNICFLIVKDPRECPNHHLFCASCIFRWSMSGGATNSRCPVCRTEGRYKPHAGLEKLLSQKHVKCPEDDCTWAGRLRDYRWHCRSHPENTEDSIELPQITPHSDGARNTNNNEEFPEYGPRSRQRLERLMESFQERLLQRRENIDRHHHEQERHRMESLEQVENLGRRLGDVSNNIGDLLNNMQQDSQRYQRYVNEAQDVLPTHEPLNNVSMSTEEARVERILASPTPTYNPFVVPSESELIGANPSPHSPGINPFVIPPEFRLPPRGLQISTRTTNTQSVRPRRPAEHSPRRHSYDLPRTARVVSRPVELRRSTIRPNRTRNSHDNI